MTPDLQALIELSAKASVGPWLALKGSESTGRQVADWAIAVDAGFTWVCTGPTWDDEHQDESYANGQFIAALVNWFRSTRAATVPQGVWLPIESAPKDGSVVLAWRFYPVAIKWTGDPEYPWEAVNLGSHPSTTLHSNGFMEADCNLTHWQPLPTPPPAELGKGE